MARQLKFRVWDGEQMLLSPSEIEHLGSWFDAHAPGALYKGGKEFMQFTGLKDSNGTDVYEGDLVKLTEQYIYEVRFEDGKFVGYHIKQEWGRWGDLKRLSDPDFAHRHHEVIGNIYENPELLTQQTTL